MIQMVIIGPALSYATPTCNTRQDVVRGKATV
ncbi:hypothetical protein FB381_3275 [Nocardioides albertanoniae]|uniref:Uncharacterized protein n=1 Tax=Nocardioides albertanoniae TaxID=1175486 RepID=A0A543AA36_9ACTN|nr:hypothetical protein FB381_3275 [Nocardioides albertanoniae]